MPNEMARSAASVRQQEIDRYVKRCEAEESEYCLRTGKTPRTRELLARGCRNTAPGGIVSFSIVRFRFYALYLVVKYHHVYVMILCIFCDELMNKSSSKLAISSEITSSRMRRPCSSTAPRWTPGPRRRSSLPTSALASSGPRTRRMAAPMRTARRASGASTALRASAHSWQGMGVLTGRVPSYDALSTAGKGRWIRS